MRRQPWLAPVALLAACSSTSGDAARTTVTTSVAPTSAATDDAVLAATICGALRDQTNVLARLANSSVAGIGALTPDERSRALVEGFDGVEAAAVEFQSIVVGLDLPAVTEAEALRAAVAGGATLAVDEVRRERAAFVGGGVGSVVPDGEVQGSVGQFFNAVEKVMSVVEPPMAGYDRPALQRAFLDEPTCRHVIQPVDLGD